MAAHGFLPDFQGGTPNCRICGKPEGDADHAQGVAEDFLAEKLAGIAKDERNDAYIRKVAAILLVAAIIIALHLFSWQRGTTCLFGRRPLREPPPPGATCLIAYPQGGYVYSR
jgi:hypothetical protein